MWWSNDRGYLGADQVANWKKAAPLRETRLAGSIPTILITFTTMEEGNLIRELAEEVDGSAKSVFLRRRRRVDYHSRTSRGKCMSSKIVS